MAFDKPKVTIDLDEYLELKRRAEAGTEYNYLLVDQRVELIVTDSPVAKHYCAVKSRIIRDDGVEYTLSVAGGAPIYMMVRTRNNK